MIRTVLFIGIFAFFPAARSQAVIRANEVLANEPGSTTSLEWFELYNDASISSNQLGFYEISINGAAVPLPASETIPANGYLVVCKNRLTFLQTFSQSLAEGQNPLPANVKLIEATGAFSLPNSSGVLKVTLVATQLSDSLVWSNNSADGVSWERKDFNFAAGRESRDFTGSTPGFVNSVTPLAIDFAVDTVGVEKIDGGSLVRVVVVNRGEQTHSSRVRVFAVDPLNPTDTTNVIAEASVDNLDTGFAAVVDIEVLVSGMYDTLGAVVDEDDRERNDRWDFVAAGELFPPFRLNEILVNPTGSYTAEWIEIKCIAGVGGDLDGWQTGDDQSLVPILSGAFPLDQSDYAVLTQSEPDFRQAYSGYAGALIEPSAWQSLNNTGDIVRLVDPYGIEAGRFNYSSGFDDNITWARSEDSSRPGDWGRSIAPGGTPGDSNIVRFTGSLSGLQVTVTPQVISPDGNGIGDRAVISVDGPVDARYTIELYDRAGRKVRVFEDAATFLKASYEFDGTDGNGRRLPIGIYIVYVEADGIESLKKTVVISR
jgi:hypothetical protein